jgi:hypothetical protein
MDIRSESQLNPVGDEVSATIAVVRPVLVGLVWRLKQDIVDEVGDRENLKLKMLARLRRPGDGDLGICFEYAVHDAIRRRDPMVLERLDAAAKLCNMPGQNLDSILFAAEKSGSEQLIDTARGLVTSQSVILSGTRGRPANLQKHIEGIAQAFRRPTSSRLPQSISGIWKADLFFGTTDADKWLGTTVKSNAAQLESARGLRVGIVPLRQGHSDLPHLDDTRNLVVCPLLYDGDFVQTFYEAWNIVLLFLAADAKVPHENVLPNPASRQVARTLEERRESPISAVLETLDVLAQPQLLHTQERKAELVLTRGTEVATQMILVPQPSQRSA